MCKCKNIEIGSHDANIPIEMPDFINDYMVKRRGKRSHKILMIDKCIAGEILTLWKHGIITTGCCCGHNKIQPYIGVIFEDISAMKSMDYQVQHNQSRPGDEDSFCPKFITKKFKPSIQLTETKYLK